MNVFQFIYDRYVIESCVVFITLDKTELIRFSIRALRGGAVPSPADLSDFQNIITLENLIVRMTGESAF